MRIRLRWPLVLPVVLFVSTAIGCGGSTGDGPGAGGAGGQPDGGGAGAGGSGGGSGGAGGADDGGQPGTPTKATRVDLLFMIDNSSSMADKQSILASTVPDLVANLANPLCVHADGSFGARPPTPSDACPAGTTRRFAPVEDMHVGVISSSLGGHGADSCSPIGSGWRPQEDDASHLLSRTGDPTASVPTYQGKGFLAWDPKAKLSPPGEADTAALSQSFSDLVTGVDQAGCGFEAQLEAVYRFLVDPEPYDHLEQGSNGLVQLVGTDTTLLAQRQSFLRPDSLVLVVSLTDEDDCSVKDGGQSYIVLQAANSGGEFHLPRGTSTCLTSPGDKCCFSCGAAAPAGCADPANDSECQKGTPTTQIDEALNLRCFHQKQRFGLDFLQPIARYVDGMRNPKITNRAGALVNNPLYSDLSGGTHPPRGPGLVVWASVVGVPWQDIAKDPNDLTKGYLSAAELTSMGKWSEIVGDPTTYVDPKDPLMIQSIEPRSGQNPSLHVDLVAPDETFAKPPAPRANPINGHEWLNPKRDDLQYACIFDLAPGAAKSCASSAASCDCHDGPTLQNPLCEDAVTGVAGTTQFAAKGYPGLRHLAVMKGLGDEGVVASICPSNLADATRTDYGYRPAIDALMRRAALSLP